MGIGSLAKSKSGVRVNDSPQARVGRIAHKCAEILLRKQIPDFREIILKSLAEKNGDTTITTLTRELFPGLSDDQFGFVRSNVYAALMIEFEGDPDVIRTLQNNAQKKREQNILRANEKRGGWTTAERQLLLRQIRHQRASGKKAINWDEIATHFDRWDRGQCQSCYYKLRGKYNVSRTYAKTANRSKRIRKP